MAGFQQTGHGSWNDIVDTDFAGFERPNLKTFFVCLTTYDVTIKNVNVAFKPQSLENTLGEYLSSKGKSQLRAAETEKYAHVTFFFNGGVEEANDGEDRLLVPSPKVATYDLQPEDEWLIYSMIHNHINTLLPYLSIY